MLPLLRICRIGLVVATACVAANLGRCEVDRCASADEQAPVKQASSVAKPVLLVGHKWSDSAGFYDAGTGKLETSVKVGRRPHELALSHDGRRAYFTLYGIDLYTETVEGGRSVAVVDIPSRTKVGEIDLGKYRRPHGIEIGPKSGRLYVTCDLPAALLVLDPQTSNVVEAIELSNPKSLCHMVAVSHEEDIAYVANCGTADIAVIDLESKREVGRIAVGGVPMGMSLALDGRTLWATTRTTNGIAVIDTESRKLTRIIEVSGQPVRTALSRDGGRLLTTLIESGEVAEIDTRSQTLGRRLRIGNRVEGLTIDPTGQFGFASAQADDKIVKFSLADWKPVLEIRTEKRPDPLTVLRP